MYLGIMRDSRRDFILIGLGAVGRTLAPALVKSGYVCRALVGRGRSGEKALARRCKARMMTSMDSLLDDFCLIFLCLRDNQIELLAKELAEKGPQLAQNIQRSPLSPPRAAGNPGLPPFTGGYKGGALSKRPEGFHSQDSFINWTSKTVLHTAGALSSEVLLPLREKGAEVASFHPFGSFIRAGGRVQFNGMTFGIEGTPRAQRIAAKIARDLGGRPLIVPAEKRALYHLAAVFASNFFVGDLALGVEMLRHIGLDEMEALQVLAPIVEGTFRNVKKLGVRNALTGPAARGDVETLMRHEKALRAMDPALAELYRRFSKYLAEIPKQGGVERNKNA